jgi:branched-chain amino acid transport system permease protein
MVAQLLVNGIVVGSVSALMALGVGLTYRTQKFFNFTYAIVFALAPYVASQLLRGAVHQFYAAAVAGVLAALLTYVALEYLIFRHLERRSSDSREKLLVSLGVFVTLEGGIALIFGAEASSFPTARFHKSLQIAGVHLTVANLAALIGCAVIICCWSLTGATSRLGTYFRAISADAALAAVVGIDVSKVTFLGAVASSVTVASAGILQAWDTGLTPSMGFAPLLSAIVSIVIGGKRGLPAYVMSAFLLGMAQQLAVIVVPARWQDFLIALVLVTFCALRQQRPREQPPGEGNE